MNGAVNQKLRESRSDRADRGRRNGGRRKWIWGSIFALLIVLAVSSGWAAKTVYDQAMEVRGHLTSATPHLAAVQRAILAGDPATASAELRAYGAEAHRAKAATEGRVWDFVEGIPLGLTENLTAVRVVAEVASDFADVVEPAVSMDLSALAPKGGRIDVAGLTAISDVLGAATPKVEEARSRLADLNRDSLLAPVADGVDQVEEQLRSVGPAIKTTAEVVKLLPNALGAGGARNYLIMVQGTSEIRASGGNPAAFLVLKVEGGAIKITRQVSSSEFNNARPESVTPLDAETEAIYSDIIGRWIPNMTATPDFPTTVAITKAWWAEEFDDQFEAVISIDPVALGYLLRATGPLQLPTGGALTSKNASSLLLKDAYTMYPKGADSNEFFATVAVTVFNGLMNGSSNPMQLVEAIGQGADEGRIKLWSSVPEEKAAIGNSALAGVLPPSNEDETAVGVFFNDTTGSKMDYFVDADVAVTSDQCQTEGSPRWTTSVNFHNQVTREEAARLPLYITGPYYTPGDIATDFVIYTPVGAKIDSWTVNGNEYPAVSRGSHLGRDVVRLSIVTPPQTSVTVDVEMSAAEGDDETSRGPLTVRHTPMVRDTPVTIDAPGCGTDAR